MSNEVPESLGAPNYAMSNEAKILRQWMIKDLEGKLLTFLETFGFPDKQERAAKSLIRNMVWDWYNNETFRIKHEDQNKLDTFLEELYPYPTASSDK